VQPRLASDGTVYWLRRAEQRAEFNYANGAITRGRSRCWRSPARASRAAWPWTADARHRVFAQTVSAIDRCRVTQTVALPAEPRQRRLG
jgi:hypothetical protein